MKYPIARRENVEDSYHGTVVQDPYRWLEDPDSEETKQWARSQQECTESFLQDIEFKKVIEEKLTSVYNFEKYGTPFKQGSRYFQYYNSGLQNQYVIYVSDSVHGEKRVFIDPNEMSADGTTSISSTVFSHDNNKVAVFIKEKGSDWDKITIKDVDSGEFLSDETWTKYGSVAWSSDDSGFFYTGYDHTPVKDQKEQGTDTGKLGNHKIFYHRLNTNQSDDVVVYQESDSDLLYGVTVTYDKRYLLITVYNSCDPENLVYYVDLSTFTPGGSVTVNKLITKFEERFAYLANKGEVFFFQTKEEVISIDLTKPEKEHWKTIIAKGDDVLESVICVNQEFLVATFLKDVKNLLKIFHLRTGELFSDVPLPTIGSVVSITAEPDDTEFFFKFSSFTSPGTIFRYDFPSAQTELVHATTVNGLDLDQFVVEQVFYQSKDSTKVPMFLIYPKDIDKTSGNNPTLLYGYGGFNHSLTPYFSSLTMAFCQGYRAVYAIANIRGGGEYGPEWHKAAQKLKKQVSFDDFIAAAEYLISEKITSPAKLAISGASNGGFLVSACMIQRPELFGAVYCRSAVLDMLRFHKFTIGHFWTSDYGSSDNLEEFQVLKNLSPYHTIKTGKPYPALFIYTSDHDDRVVPLHSYKFAAELQHLLGNEPYQTNPLLLYVELDTGHGAGLSTTKIINEYAAWFAFYGAVLNVQWN